MKLKKKTKQKLRKALLILIVIYSLSYLTFRYRLVNSSPINIVPDFIDSSERVVLIRSNDTHQLCYRIFWPIIKIEELCGTLNLKQLL